MREILKIESACSIFPQKNGFKVILYNVVGRRERMVKFFKTFEETHYYVENRMRKAMCKKMWRKQEYERKKRIYLDYRIRQNGRQYLSKKDNEYEYLLIT